MPSFQPTLHFKIKKKVNVGTSHKSTLKVQNENENSEDIECPKGLELNVSPRPRHRGRPRSLLDDSNHYATEDVDLQLDNNGHLYTRLRSSPRPTLTGQNEPSNAEPSQQSTSRGRCLPRPTSVPSQRCTKRLFQNNEDTSETQSHSPPKQGRDASTSPKTPTQLISKLHLSSPSTTREDDDTKTLFPKQLFDTGVTYQHVRQALHSTTPEEMPGREKQLSELHAFLESHLESNTSATLYVSGPPGTGKTACLSKTMLTKQFQVGYKMVYVNCTSMKSAVCIYRRICEELAVKTSVKTAKDYQILIEKYLAVHKKMILLVLDEIDQLDSKNQSVLYTIFEWPSKKDSKLVLVGIANALDLTDRILPRLQARLELKPVLMHFSPYTKEQIVGILSGRLKKSDASHILTPVAVQLVAAKVASMSGDARRALDIARRVVDKASEQSLPLKPTTDHALNTTSPKKVNVSSVHLKDVMSVLNTAYGASQTLEEDCNESFPLQQKVVLCTLLLIVTKGKTKDVTIGKLYSVYRQVCVKRKLPSVGQAELLSLCGLLATRGIIRLQTAKEPRLHKVCLQWDEEEVGSVLKDKQLLEAILKDTTCLSQLKN